MDRSRTCCWCVVLAMSVLLLKVTAWCGQEPFVVKLEESRSAVQNDALRKGLDVIDRKLQVDNLTMWYHRLVDKQNKDQPKMFSYGDFFMTCRFGGFGNGGWDPEYFLKVEVGYPKGPTWNVIQDLLQENIYILEQSDRALVDLVWPVPPPPGGDGNGGVVLVRLAKTPGSTRWLHLQIQLKATQGAELRNVSVSGYPGNTAGAPERQRWAKTELQDGNLQTGVTLKLDPTKEWSVAMYNRNEQEEDANLAVFLPKEIQSAWVAGTYNVGLSLVPRRGCDTVHLSLGFYTGLVNIQGNAQFLKEAPLVQEILEKVKWQPDFARMVNLEAIAKEYDPLLVLPGTRKRIGKEVDALMKEVDQIQKSLVLEAQAGQPPNYSQVINLTQKIERLRSMRDRLYAAAVEALVESME